MGILTISILILVIILVIFFFLYKKIIAVAAFFIFVVFIGSIVCILSALFFPQIYKSGAELLVKDSSFGTELKNFDGTITNIENLPTSVVNSIGNLFGQNSQTQTFKSDLYNQFVDFTGSLIRIMVLIVAIILMVISVYVRYSYAGVIESEKLSKRVLELEREIRSMKGIQRA